MEEGRSVGFLEDGDKVVDAVPAERHQASAKTVRNRFVERERDQLCVLSDAPEKTTSVRASCQSEALGERSGWGETYSAIQVKLRISCSLSLTNE